MIFSVAYTIAYISSLMTLESGDVIATGTPEGVGFKRTPSIFIKDGDIVEVEVENTNGISKQHGREPCAVLLRTYTELRCQV